MSGGRYGPSVEGPDVLRMIDEGLSVEAAVYERRPDGEWPTGARHGLYERAHGAAWALSLAELVTDEEARSFLIRWHVRTGASKE